MIDVFRRSRPSSCRISTWTYGSWAKWNRSWPKVPSGAMRVIIGKHGLIIAKGGRQGLLLPGVAVEHHLDAEGFLEQVCRKAGLPADAWQDEDAALMTFQGHAIEGELKTLFDDSLRALGQRGSGRYARAADGVGRAGLRARKRHRPAAGTCDAPPGSRTGRRGNPCRYLSPEPPALMIGATPAYYVPDAFDGGVQGIVLSLQLPGRAEQDRLQPGQCPGGNAAAVNLVRTDQGRRRALATKRRPSRGNLRGRH